MPVGPLCAVIWSYFALTIEDLFTSEIPPEIQEMWRFVESGRKDALFLLDPFMVQHLQRYKALYERRFVLLSPSFSYRWSLWNGLQEPGHFVFKNRQVLKPKDLFPTLVDDSAITMQTSPALLKFTLKENVEMLMAKDDLSILCEKGLLPSLPRPLRPPSKRKRPA